MADKPKGTTDNFISRIVKDPKQVPDALLLTGYLGASSEDKHTRLYFNAQLSNYVEIPDDGILNTQEFPGDPLGSSFVWIKQDAVLKHGKAGTKAKFLEGSIVNEYMNAAGIGLGQQGTGGTNNSIFICQETFQDFNCGTTKHGWLCTIVQLPTQQFGCPTQIHWQCPPPPTPNCPTHVNPPFICHTLICEIKDVGFQQQQVQPLGLTFQPQMCIPSQIPQCHPTIIGPHCITHNSPICNYTISGLVCPTIIQQVCHPTVTGPNCVTQNTPPCNYTISGMVCPTHTPACHPSVNVVCHTLSPACQHATLTPACIPHQTLQCPSFGPCPSIACGAGGFGGGNPGF